MPEEKKSIPMFSNWWNAVEFSVSVSRPELMNAAIGMMREDDAEGSGGPENSMIEVHKDTMETLLMTIGLLMTEKIKKYDPDEHLSLLGELSTNLEIIRTTAEELETEVDSALEVMRKRN